MNCKVSIIIPVYNGEKFIKKCIESILKQTYQNYEIIIINDGSTDRTKETIESLKSEKIKLYNIKNAGVSNARNYGINQANGDYILFVDADDKIDNKTLEILVNKQKEYKVDIIRYNGYIQDEKGNFAKLEMPIDNNTIINSKRDLKKIIKLINGSLRCYSPLLFIRNSNIIQFDSSLTYLEDKLFYLQNMTNGDKKILFIDEILYYYNYNKSSKTKDINNFKNNIVDMLEATKKIDSVVKELGDKSNITNCSLLSLFIYRIEYLANISKYKEFKLVMDALFKINEFKQLIDMDNIMVKDTQKIFYKLLQRKSFFLLYTMLRIKKVIKGMKN